MLVDWLSFTNSIVPISTSNLISITSISLSSLIISRVTEAETSLLPVLSGFQYSPWTGRLRNGQGLCENWVNVRGRSSWWGRVPEWDERQVLAVFFFCIYFIVLDRLCLKVHISKLYRGRPTVSNWHSPPASSHLRTPPHHWQGSRVQRGLVSPTQFLQGSSLSFKYMLYMSRVGWSWAVHNMAHSMLQGCCWICGFIWLRSRLTVQIRCEVFCSVT